MIRNITIDEDEILEETGKKLLKEEKQNTITEDKNLKTVKETFKLKEEKLDISNDSKDNSIASINREKSELEELTEKISIKEKQYSNSLDENLNGDEAILQELNLLKSKRSKLMAAKRQVVMSSYKGLQLSEEVKRNSTSDIKNEKETANVAFEKEDKKKTTSGVEIRFRKDIDKENSKNIIMQHANFDIVRGVWCFKFLEDGVLKETEYPYKKEEMKKLNNYIKEKRKKYGNKKIKRIDIGLYSSLCGFDIDNKTDYSKKYLYNETPYCISYNLVKIFTSAFYPLKDKINLLIKANSQRRYRKVIVSNPKSMVLAPAALGISLLLGSFGINAKKNESNYNEATQYLQETTTEQICDDVISTRKSVNSKENDYEKVKIYNQNNLKKVDNHSKLEQLYKIREELTSDTGLLENQKTYKKVI